MNNTRIQERLGWLSLTLAELQATLTLPDEIKLTVDIDPVNLM